MDTPASAIVSTWDLDTFENYIAKRVFGWQIVSTWNLVIFEDYRGETA